MNKRGQFSIITALLVSIILVSTVIITYSMILNNSIQVQPQVLTAIDETNSAIKQLLGFSVGYYGSVIQVSGDNSFANQSTWNYTTSGLQYIANTHADWGAGFNIANLTTHTYWFNSTSYSTGYLAVTYNLTKLGIYGMQYTPSCGLTVQTANSTGTNQTTLTVTQDQNQPVTNLQGQNFKFYNYTNSKWQLTPPSATPTVYANGTYQIQPPTGVDASSYVVQVEDQRGIMVVATLMSSYTINLAWPSPSNATTSSYYYVNNNSSDVDRNGNTGLQSNFTAQQYGPDNIYDTLTEADIPAIAGSSQYVQTNSPQHDTNVGGTSNFPTEQSTDNIYDTLTEADIPAIAGSSQYVQTNNQLHDTDIGSTSNFTTEKYTDNIYDTLTEANTHAASSSFGNAVRGSSYVQLTASHMYGQSFASPSYASTVYNITFYGYFSSGTHNVKAILVLASNLNIVTNGISSPVSIGTSANWYTATFSPAPSISASTNYVLMIISDTSYFNIYYTSASGGTSYDDTTNSYTSPSSPTDATSQIYQNSIYANCSLTPNYQLDLERQWTSAPIGNASELLCIETGTLDSSEQLEVDVWTGTGWTFLTSSLVASQWNNFSISSYLTSATFNIRFIDTTRTGDPTQSTWQIDSVLLTTTNSTDNYQLDLERQWTSAPYNANASKQLCIKTGAFNSSESLEVDVWWNAAWSVLNGNLAANQWNNMSVSSYLTSATFNIRFIDTTRTGDATQSTWQVDSVLLTTTNSTDNYQLDIEEQWTSINYTGTNKYLGIFTRAFSSPAETLSVQWWNATSSSWSPLIQSLNANTWNNVSVTTYITSSNFTLRFLNGAQGGDPVQGSWQVDASLVMLNGTTYFPVSGYNSKVDSNSDVGTHSNFTAQQYGPDSSYDTLMEAQDPNAVLNYYYPTSYTMIGNTNLLSGSLSSLQSDNSQYMQFNSWASATAATTLYSHGEQTSIGGSNYYQLKLASADASGTLLTGSMSSVGRTLLGQLIYPLTGVNTINASTWTIYYEAWKDQPIAYDAPSSSAPQSSGQTLSWTHNVGTGSNRLLVVTINIYNSGGTPATCSGCTYGGVAMTQNVTNAYTATNPQVRSYIFTLTNPASGSGTIKASFSSSTSSVGGAVSYSGVNQISPIQATNSAVGSGTAPSISVSAPANGTVYGSLASYRTSSYSPTYTITDAAGQTEAWSQTSQQSTSQFDGEGDYELNDTGSASIGWTLSQTASYVTLAVAINPAVSASHCDVDILVRQSDNTIRNTVATNVAASGTITASQSTLSGTYSWSSYSVVSQTDYLEIDFYVDTTTACPGINAHLEIDGNSLPTTSQTRINNIFLPSQFTAQMVFEGVSDAYSWNSLNWTLNSHFSISGATATCQLYNFQTGTYPTSSDGYSQTTIGTSDVTQTQLITANPVYYKNATNWFRMQITCQAATTSPFTWSADLLLFSPTVTNYVLNLEEQWTNVSYSYPAQADLCIKTGALGSEALNVDEWDGSNWTNILSNLTPNSWNNASVFSVLQSSTFTVRFRDGNESFDSAQDSWQIDVALLTFRGTIQSVRPNDILTIELLQNGTLRWLGQSLQLTTQAMPIPPLPVKSIHVNQTINSFNSEVPFQIEDWSPDYLIPLGLTGNLSLFSSGNMIVFLANNNVSKVTMWWNGSDLATQTPYAFVDRYFTGDSPSTGSLTNGILTLRFTGDFQPVVSSIGSTSCNANFMRVNGIASTYGASPAYVIAFGVVRDIVQQEAEWSGGITNCPNVYSQIVLTLPANATYYTYQLRAIFVQSQQNRNIADLCPIELQSSVTQAQTENGTVSGYPIVSTATSTFYNQSAISAHHWSQLTSGSGSNGVGIMFTDSGNNQLYNFDSIAGTQTGGLRVNATAGTIELVPVSSMAPVSFNYALDTVWAGAVSTFSNTTPIYQTASGQVSGSWISVEYPPTLAVYTGP